MTLALVLALGAAPRAPAECEPLWAKAWKSFLSRELKGAAPPKTPRVPNAVELIHKAFLAECAAMPKETFACARGEERERVVAELRKQLKADKAAPAAIAEAEAKYRAGWSVLDCPGVDDALQRAGDRVGADAGL